MWGGGCVIKMANMATREALIGSGSHPECVNVCEAALKKCAILTGPVDFGLNS